MKLCGTAPTLLLTATLFACGSAVSSPAQTPGERLVAGMELIRDGKPQDLEALVVSDDRLGVAMFSGVYASGWAHEGGLNRVEVLSEDINGDSATVGARFHFVNGNTDDLTYRLAREDDVWKIILP
jgi:hypothetical protein